MLCGKDDRPPDRGKNLSKDTEDEQVDPVQEALAAASWGQRGGKGLTAQPMAPERKLRLKWF